MSIRPTGATTLFLAALSACTGGGGSDGDSGAPGGVVQAPPPVRTPAQRVHPTLRVTGPLGGLFAGDGPVRVQGAAGVGSAPLRALQVGGESAALSADGTFDHPVTPAPGIHIIPLKVEAQDTGRAVEVVSVLAGPVHPPGARLERAMLIHLGQELLDDDAPDIDDIARLVEILLTDPGFAEWLKSARFGSDDDVKVFHFAADAAAVDFAARPECLTTSVRLGDAARADDPGFALGIKVRGLTAALGEEISLTGDEVTVSADLCPRLSDVGRLKTEVGAAEVQFVGLSIATDKFPRLAEELPATHDSLVEIANRLLADALAKSLGQLLDQFLGSFEVDLPLWDDPPIRAKLVLDPPNLREGAVVLTLSHEPTVGLGLPGGAPPGAGSYATDDPAPAVALTTRPLGVAVSDDLANQLLFAFWWAGAASSLGLGESLAAIDTSKLPDVFQPLSDVTLDMGLPPTLMAAAQPDFPFDLAVGELNLRLQAGPEKRFDISVHLRAGVDLLPAPASEGGAITLNIDNRARQITAAAAVRALPEGLDPGDVAALIRMMLPALLGQAKTSLPGLSVPTIRMDSLALLAAIDQLRGKALGFAAPDVKKVGEGGGYIVFEGGVSLVDAPPPPPE